MRRGWKGKGDVSNGTPAPPRSVLLVLLGAIGDVVRALPLVQRLRAGWPGTRIIWAVEPPAAPIVQGHPAVDEVIVFGRGGGHGAFVRFLRKVRASRPDLTLDLQRLGKSGLTSWYSGAPVRVGFHRRNSREGNWFFNTDTIPPVERFTSKLGHFLRFADHLGLPPTAVSFGLDPTPEERVQAARWVGGTADRFAAVFVGSTWPSCRWLPAPTAALCRGLRARGLRVMMLGGPADEAFAAAVLAAGAGDVVNSVGRTSLRDVIAILDRATVAIGPDTGPMHIAAAVGTPVVSLFGPTSPARSGPFGAEDLVVRCDVSCAPCYLRHCPIGQLCMEMITPEAVLARVDMALSTRGEGSASAEGQR